jgi:hypothetical protein
MPHVSSGLVTQSPVPAVGEIVINPGFPYSKLFTVFNAVASAVLEFDVFTSYDTWAWPLADIRINGTSIGQIPPRSYTQTAGELAPVSFLFNTTAFLPGGALGRTSGNNRLEIVPQFANVDYLVVNNWRIHYMQLSPP